MPAKAGTPAKGPRLHLTITTQRPYFMGFLEKGTKYPTVA